MRFLSKSALFILFFVIASTQAAPVSKRCSKQCDESRNLFNYKVGKKYVYAFKNKIIADVPKGTTEQVQLALTAKAEFHIIDKCDVVLSLTGVSMKESLLNGGTVSESRDLKELPEALQKNALTFGFNDGRVTNICSDDVNDDSARPALNVKRAIISQFQISMEHLETPTSLTERDVSGDCLTEYRFKGRSNNNIQIEKMKTILGCANRKMSYSDLQGQSFDRPTETSQMPLLKGNQNCALQVSPELHLISSECEESQVFRPFSGKKSGATISVSQSLSLKSISESTTKRPKFDDSNSGDLLLEHSPDGYRNYRTDDDTLVAEDVLKKICVDIQKDPASASKIIAPNFPKLVRYMRDLNVDELRSLQAKIGTAICKKNKAMARGVFQDAIPMIRTSDAVVFMLDELSKGKSQDYRRSWLFSLATVREPTMEMIKKLSEIGAKLNNPLITSSLVATYCKVNDMCDEEAAVKSIVERITKDLGNDCSGNKAKVLLALRAIGNLGMTSNWGVLNRCIKNEKISMNVRVSAVQAMRKVRCGSQGWKDVDLISVFRKPTEDPELRINSYLSLITCSARPGVLEAIIGQLKDENCQQVGSFVWTHLSNILETSQVFRQALRASLRKFNFDPSMHAKKFNLDYRKFSRNYEKSYFYEPLNSGLSGESNVIFSSDSFLPRSMSVNLTAGLFGKSISLIELGVRGNNLDPMFRAASQSATTKGNGKMIHFSIDKWKQNFGKQVGAPSADFYVRMFGNELAYVSDFQLGNMAAGGGMAQLSRLGQALNNMKFENTRMMMEALVSVPTISGFPIELSLDLASSVRMSAGMNMAKTQSGMSIMTTYEPSGAVGVTGRMRLNAESTEIGIGFDGVMFRNFKMGGKMTYSKNEVTLLMDAPQEKATLIDMKSQMFLVHKRANRPQKMSAERGEFQLCNTKRSQNIMGLQFCIQANYANNSQVSGGPSFPFTGDNQLSVAIVPLAKVAKFKMRGKYEKTQETLLGVRSLELEMNAVGPTERQLLFAFNDKTKGLNIDMSLKMFSPIKKFEISAKGDLAKREMDASVKVDTKTLLQLTSKHKMEAGRSITTVALDAPNKPKYMEATLSSNPSVPMSELDHIFEFKSKEFFIRFLEVTVLKKFSGDLATSEYSFEIAGAQRSANGKFNLKMKEAATDGALELTVKQKSAVQFSWKNSFSAKTTFGKSVNDDANLVTEHTVKFSNSFDYDKLSFANVKDGVLVIQHEYSPDNPDSKRFMHYSLKADDLKHATTFQISQTQEPFALILNTSLRYKKMKMDNKLNVAVNSWKAVRIQNVFMRGNLKYSLSIENTVKPEKIIQEAKVMFPGRLYHLQSSFVNVDDTTYEHKARVAWANDKSVELTSKIDWGTLLEFSSCRLFYQINSTALQNGQRLGNFYINSCPNLLNRALSLEAQVSGKDKKRIAMFRSDAVFKTNPNDFHIGGSTETDIPGVINFLFRTNHIYALKKSIEVTSEMSAEYTLKNAKDAKIYGYRFLGKRSEKVVDGKLTVDYVYPAIGQLTSKYGFRMDFVEKTAKGGKVITKLDMDSMMVGKAELTMTTTYKQAGKKISVSMINVFNGKLDLLSSYSFEGNQGIDLKYTSGKILKLDEKTELEIKNLDDSKSSKYEYKYSLTMDKLDKPFLTGVKLIFKSNFALEKLSYKSRSTYESIQDGFEYDSTDEMSWRYNGNDGKFEWRIKAKSTPTLFVGTSETTSSFEKLKLFKLKIQVNQDLEEPALDISGKYNDREATFRIDGKYAKKPAKNLKEEPDFRFGVSLKGDIPYVRDGSMMIKIFYREMMFFMFDTNIVHMGPQKSNVYVYAGYSLDDMVAKVELGATTPFKTPKLMMKIGVDGKTDSNLEPMGLISQRLVMVKKAEARFVFGEFVNVDFSVMQNNRKKGAEFIGLGSINVNGKAIIPEKTKLTLMFEENDLAANKGKLYFQQKSKAVFETFQITFDYNFVEAYSFKTETKFRLRKYFSLGFDFPAGSDQKKTMELYFKPSDEVGSLLIDYKGGFMSTPLNFDSSLKLTSKITGRIELEISLFQSVKGKGKDTSLMKNAAKAFSFSLSTSLAQMKDLQLESAMTDMKGSLLFKLTAKKTTTAKITVDMSNPSKLTGSVEFNSKKVDVVLERKGSDAKLTVQANGKKVGEANFKYNAGKIVAFSLDATAPSGQKIELKVKQQHPKGKWDWKQWLHESSADISSGGKRIFQASQEVSFEFDPAKKISSLKTNFETSTDALKVFKTSGSVGWSGGLSTSLDVDFRGLGSSRFTINHNVKDWKKFYLSALNKVELKSTSNFQLILNAESDPSKKVTFEISTDLFPYVSLIHLSSNEKFVLKFMSKSYIGDINFESNILAAATKEYYIRGEVPRYGKVSLSFGFLGNNDYKLHVTIGQQFVTLYPTFNFKSKQLPFDASLNIKIETSFEKILTGNVEIVQKVGEEYFSAEHKTQISLLGSNYLVVAASYDVMKEDKGGKLSIEKEGNSLLAEVSYNPSTSLYKHNIVTMRKALGKRPVFESVAECAPYSFSLDDAKCSLSILYSRTKMIIEAVNESNDKKITKTFKLALNDLKGLFVKAIFEATPVGKEREQMSLTLRTPIRSYKVQLTRHVISGFVSELKLSTLDPSLKTTVGFVNFLMEIQPKDETNYKYVVRLQSSLLKKEIKTIVNNAINDDGTMTVTADMYIDKATPSLSMTFKMSGFAEKRNLELKLVGGDRYLNMFLNYDFLNAEKKIDVGARAKDWKRELSILFERGRKLETVVDTGKSKQTVKFISMPMAQNNGYRNTLIIDYPEVRGFLKIMLQLNRSPLSLMVIVQRDKSKPKNQLVFNGRFMNSRNILMEIKRIIGSNQITDAYTQVTLSADKVIDTRLKWRPEVFSDTKNFLLTELAPTKVNEYLKNRGEGLIEVVQRVSSAIAAPIKANVKLREALNAGQAMINDFEIVKRGITSFYRDYKLIIIKPLRLTKLVDTMMGILNQISDYIGMAFEGLKRAPSIPINFDYNQAYTALEQQYKMMYQMIQQYTKDWNDQLFINFLSKTKDVIVMSARKFNAWLDKATVVTKRWAERRDQFLEVMRARVGASFGPSSNYLAQMQGMMRKLRCTISSVVVDKLFSKEDLQELNEMAQKLNSLNNWIRSAFRASKKYSDLQLSMRLLANGDLKQAFVTYFKPQKNKITDWKLQNGFARWQVYFPYDIKSLQSVPAAIFSYTQSRLRSTVKEVRQGTFALGKYYVRLNELIFRFSLNEALRRQLPPFKANAWISGSQHFVTFDGVGVEHSGDCTYLLAHDFVNHAYSVLGEYSKKGMMIKRQNLIVQTSKAAIYISPEGSLKARESSSAQPQTRMAPFAAGDLFVSRWGSVLTVKGPNDLSIRCFLDLDVCRITVSQWSHSHINGFLGSNDYEKGNDVYRGNEKNVIPFSFHAEAWQVGKCKNKNFAVSHSTYGRDTKAYKSCSILDQAGIFSRCFSKVDPSSYLKSCMNMHQMAGKMSSLHVCRIFLMYVSKCRAEGITLQMPRSCLVCGETSRRGLMKWRKPFSIKQKLKKNFVFIVEAKPCLKKISSIFKNLVTILSRDEDDTYNLISFGGQGNFRDPTLHMLDSSRTRGNKNDFVKDMDRLKLNGKDSDDDGVVATKAVQMALRLNDDASSATVIVLISCSKCKESIQYQYTNMQRRYSKRGIRFHYFLPHNFGSVGNKRVAGFAPPSAFNEKGSSIARKLMRRIRRPRDTCSALARATGGSFWDTNTLLKMRSPIRNSMLKNTLKKQYNNRRVCSCTGSVSNDDVFQCKDRK